MTRGPHAPTRHLRPARSTGAPTGGTPKPHGRVKIFGVSFERFVAVGDSFTEGVGDPDLTLPNGVRGWADRAASVLAGQSTSFHYANLAIRGRKMLGVLDEQIEPALAMQPDLVSMYAGGNDVLRPKVDIDSLMLGYDTAVERMRASGAQVVLFTPFDPGGFAIYAPLRGRFALYAEYVREIADRHGALIVDNWRLRGVYDDSRLWDVDRLHMSGAGHHRMAMQFLDALGVEHDLKPLPLPDAPQRTIRQRRAENLEWARLYAGPWVKRRLTGTSSGDGVSPRWPTLVPM